MSRGSGIIVLSHDASQAVRVKQYHRVVLISNDTDSFALLVHYAQYLQTLGVKDIWQQYGTGEKRHMLPLHQTVSQFGAPFAKTVIRGHIIVTGDDYMRKVGTKHAAEACNPVEHLTQFGETDTLSYQDVVLAEAVGLLGTCLGTGQIFHQFRVQHYTNSRAGIYARTPKSSDTRGTSIEEAFLSTEHAECLPQTMSARQN